MKFKINNRNLTLALTLVLILGLTDCADMFKDPLTDKNTGDRVTLLLLDRNFIKTKLSIRVQDVATNEDISQEEVEIRFMGAGAANLITFAGYKQSVYNTGSGYIEVGVDPNIPINGQNPLELTVIAVSPNYISAPQFVSYTTEGVKNIKISMVKKIVGKSFASGPFSEPYDLVYNGNLHSSQLTFQSDISSLPTGTAWKYINMYGTTASGTLICNNLSDAILYEDYGAYFYSMVSGSGLVPPALPTKNVALQNTDIVYSGILRSGMARCDQGLFINTSRTDGKAGTAVFDYVITFSDGQTKTGQITVTFPSSNLIEPLYYPASNPAVTVQLTGDSQYDLSGAVTLTSACGAVASFTATPKSTLKTYKFITRYSCPDSPVGMGLSIVGEFRKTGSSGAWTSFEFIEGISELLLEPNVDYDFRVNIDGEFYSYTVPTDVSKVEAFLRERQNEKYTIKSLVITSTETLETIDADIEFAEGICDAIR